MGELLDLEYARELRDRLGGTGRLDRALARGELVRIRRGYYAARPEWERVDDPAHRLARIAAARAAARGEPVFSHEAAAALHGIPLLGAAAHEVRTTVPPGGGWSNGSVRRIQRRLALEDVVTLPDGTRATSAVRTAIDLAATGSELGGIVAFSHLRRAGVALAAFEDGLRRAGRMHGIGAARHALARSTAGSDSPLETLVAVRCADLGFASPEQQRGVRGADGVRYRVDFAWRGGRILAEADGKLKYRADPQGRRTPSQVLWAEKRREDALRARCDAFLRIDWSDAWSGVALEHALVAAGVPRVAMPRRELTF